MTASRQAPPGRPAKFSRVRLQRAALEIVDAHGVEGLSMRALAHALGTGPMTLYGHVRDRAELDVLVADAVLGEVEWSVPAGADWRAATVAIATALWTAVRAHPRAIPLILARRSRSRVVLDVSEALLAELARSGRRGAALLGAFRALTALVVGFAQVELASPLALQAGESPAAAIARVRALPPGRHPRLREIARAAARSRAEHEFRAGLDALLDGLAAGSSSGASRSARPRRPAPRRAPRA